VPEPQLDQPSDRPEGVYLSGKFYLCSISTQSTFDLDEGILGGSDAGSSDLVLELGKATIDNRIIYYLSEINNALVEESNIDSPTLEHCEELVSSPVRLGYIFGEVGAVGCVLTNEGRLAFFRVEHLDPFGAESVEVSFVTWKKK
jgi:hypothetical protein